MRFGNVGRYRNSDDIQNSRKGGDRFHSLVSCARVGYDVLGNTYPIVAEILRTRIRHLIIQRESSPRFKNSVNFLGHIKLSVGCRCRCSCRCAQMWW